MSKLETLVPPLELCKKIPAGEFEDSAFCWIDKGCTCVLPVDVMFPARPPFIELRRYTIQGDEIPCPTLQEIMVALPPCTCYRLTDDWRVGLINDYYFSGIKSTNPTTAALKLWLKLKGIEYA